MNRHFILLFGPPAVGKMAVGDDLSKLTGIPLFHNHMSIEPVLRLFPNGGPAFRRLVDGFRDSIFQEVAASDLPGLIFTLAWDLNDQADAEFVSNVCRLFEDAGAEILLVELKADLKTRLSRNRDTRRLSEKPSKRDVEASEKRLLANEETFLMNSVSSLPVPWPHIVIDNTHVSSTEVARKIASHLTTIVSE